MLTEDVDPIMTSEDYYQMVVMHQDHGRSTIEFPVFDLGQFRPEEANKVANYMLALTQHLNLEMFEGVVANVVEAWGSLSYRCWLLPLDGAKSVLEINAEGIVEVPAYHDPR